MCMVYQMCISVSTLVVAVALQQYHKVTCCDQDVMHLLVDIVVVLTTTAANYKLHYEGIAVVDDTLLLQITQNRIAIYVEIKVVYVHTQQR